MQFADAAAGQLSYQVAEVNPAMSAGSNRPVSDEVLALYLADQLDEAERKGVEERLARDPELRERVEFLKEAVRKSPEELPEVEIPKDLFLKRPDEGK